MFALVYRSRAVPGFGPVQIQEMLEKARPYNSEQGITGCLLFHEGEFLQYLEGNQIRVLKLFDKIKNDPRHTDMELISHGNRPERWFKDWEMAFEDFYGDNDQISYLKLLVEGHLGDLEVNISDPAVYAFWENVSRMLRGDLQASP
ncbi:BLUF domain-containing protein [Lentiprolixibacter aurantiacus]|uniref:BLUF domain-containing protein n=1 Tax=Lentiprolixibacter aurantiacus TaxID=2993939 RepID=A0AAE3SM76_9FLAO|nr:BLUF domain-containing protein [Lentiprolixibacter aurantiacus]MCX2718155.1 BLUF domain-containing protein [Lentiprolixibacter aurantiacus]